MNCSVFPKVYYILHKSDFFPFSGVEEQPSESERYGDLEGGLSMYGVVKRKRDNDMELHSNKQVCGGCGGRRIGLYRLPLLHKINNFTLTL